MADLKKYSVSVRISTDAIVLAENEYMARLIVARDLAYWDCRKAEVSPANADDVPDLAQDANSEDGYSDYETWQSWQEDQADEVSTDGR